MIEYLVNIVYLVNINLVNIGSFEKHWELKNNKSCKLDFKLHFKRLHLFHQV